jgi:hypothetical protein
VIQLFVDLDIPNIRRWEPTFTCSPVNCLQVPASKGSIVVHVPLNMMVALFLSV